MAQLFSFTVPDSNCEFSNLPKIYSILSKTKNLTNFNFTDIFSGENYKHLREEKIVGDKDICIVMYVDGFQNKHKPDSSQTMIHSIIMNLDPSVSRFERSYTG
ncbi:hypothetical protein BD770DRAFT_414741 [Pilaira anomala]|nr:hypothetical protein BD770DRAFT_414741 [Pilaira anomala]